MPTQDPPADRPRDPGSGSTAPTDTRLDRMSSDATGGPPLLHEPDRASVVIDGSAVILDGLRIVDSTLAQLVGRRAAEERERGAAT